MSPFRYSYSCGELLEGARAHRQTFDVPMILSEGPYGTYVLRSDVDGREHLAQGDWDVPGIASTFRWQPCECGRTDGTVDCPHRTVSELICEARAYLDRHLGALVDDPGHF